MLLKFLCLSDIPGELLSVEKFAFTKLLTKPSRGLPPANGALVEIKPSAEGKTATQFLFKDLKGLKCKLNIERNVKHVYRTCINN